MQRNESEPLCMNLKYYFISHREYTEATGKEGKKGQEGCQHVCHGALSAERVMDYFLSSICYSQHCFPSPLAVAASPVQVWPLQKPPLPLPAELGWMQGIWAPVLRGNLREKQVGEGKTGVTQTGILLCQSLR